MHIAIYRVQVDMHSVMHSILWTCVRGSGGLHLAGGAPPIGFKVTREALTTIFSGLPAEEVRGPPALLSPLSLLGCWFIPDSSFFSRSFFVMLSKDVLHPSWWLVGPPIREDLVPMFNSL